ncbi:LOW QUALITY PROTEIN: hypothetical protein HID58_044001 [Brassica napus]|uniref:Uncharacterized protein n=1 Tax=Brassica napus TaxID=3708 RepID=A0ABQ8BIC3_BRANA|nr:LOW QUALITY PROTEIN: hypothetical protein HID58_044001 [Brassica napus]
MELGFKTDQLLSKQLRLYGSCGSVEDARRLFYDIYNSKLAGFGIPLAINGGGNEAITNMPRGLSKTHATYWNTMLGCSHIGETGYAHYLLGRAFKCSGIEPSMELLGAYVRRFSQALPGKNIEGYEVQAKSGDGGDYIVQYLEEQEVSFYI